MGKVKMFILSIFILSLGLGCENFKFKKDKETVSGEGEISGPLLAQVDNWKIGLEDFEKRLKSIEPLAKEQGVNINNYDFKRRVLTELVNNALLAGEAKRRGLDKDKDFKIALENFKQNLLAQLLLEKETADIVVTEAEISEFYNQKKQLFKSPEEIKIREIVLNDKSTANDLYIQLLQGEDFASLATKYSVADSKNKGGDLGYLQPDLKVKFQKFWEVALALDKGEISSIFKGEDGKYYIIKVEDKKEGKTLPLSEIKEDLKKALKAEKENKKLEELLNEAKARAKVVINEDLLR